MALFIDGLPCGLCRRPMSKSESLFATTHFGCSDHELAILDDGVAHWACYAEWPHQRRFARLYFREVYASLANNEFWDIVHADPSVLVAVNPEPSVSSAEVTLAESGSSLRVPCRDWAAFLAGDGVEGCAHELEQVALIRVLPTLRAELPDTDALVQRAI